jgi:hypothetical protein
LHGETTPSALSPDSKRLAATGDNGLVMIWDADSGK